MNFFTHYFSAFLSCYLEVTYNPRESRDDEGRSRVRQKFEGTPHAGKTVEWMNMYRTQTRTKTCHDGRVAGRETGSGDWRAEGAEEEQEDKKGM